MATIDDAFKEVRKRLYNFDSHNAFNYSGHVGRAERKLKLVPGTLDQMFEEHCTVSLHKYAERCATAYNNRDRSNPVMPDIPYKCEKPKIDSPKIIEPTKKEKKRRVPKKKTSPPPLIDPREIEVSPRLTKSQYPLMATVSISSNSRDYPISQEALDQYGSEYDIHDVLKDKDSIADIQSGLEDALKRQGSHLKNGEIVGAGTRFKIKNGVVDGLEFID